MPHLPFDKKNEFKNRVATASFFLSQMGERGYISARLFEHFGGRECIKENFLHLNVAVLDMSDEELIWLKSFLDSLLNPAIAFNLSFRFDFQDDFPLLDKENFFLLQNFEEEHFSKNPVFRNRRVLRDGKTVLPTALFPLYRNKKAKRNSTVKNRTKITPRKCNDFIPIPVLRTPAWSDFLHILSPSKTLQDNWSVNETLSFTLRYHRIRNKKYLRNKSIKRIKEALYADK